MISAITFFSMRLHDDLEQPGGTHAAADAHGDHHQLRAAALAFDQRMAHEPRARHAIRMTQRDGAAIHVEPVVRNAELVAAVDAPAPRTPR